MKWGACYRAASIYTLHQHVDPEIVRAFALSCYRDLVGHDLVLKIGQMRALSRAGTSEGAGGGVRAGELYGAGYLSSSRVMQLLLSAMLLSLPRCITYIVAVPNFHLITQ